VTVNKKSRAKRRFATVTVNKKVERNSVSLYNKLKRSSIMRNMLFHFLCAAVVFVGMVIGAVLYAHGEEPDKTQRERGSLYKAPGTPQWARLNINNFTAWVRYDNSGHLSPHSDNLGVFPRGTGNVIYTDGLVWGGKMFRDAAHTQGPPTQTVRVGGKVYGVGTRAGRVIGMGANAVRQDPGDPDVRAYRIRRDWLTMSEDELKLDASETFEVPLLEVTPDQMKAVKDQYAKDWDEWPVKYGAPFIDRNGNGVYDKPPAFNFDSTKGPLFTPESLITQRKDEPGVAGADPNSPADQVIWTVFNDLDREQTTGLQYSEPVGLEVQFTMWGYKRTDALGNLYFKKFKIINKGGVDIGGGKGTFYIDSMYVCQWSDPDNGSFSDDLAGCDTVLSMGFVYNGGAIDATFRKFGLPPPAVGYDFLQGPKIPSPGDSAVFDLKKIYGYKNLGMTTFAYFSAGSPYSDPCNRGTAGYACNTGQWWKMLRGFAPVGDISTADQPYASGPFPVSKFPLSGDPVTRTGFIDGLGTLYSFVPGDRRILVITGPFTMAPGDTQDIVVGVVAGLGADRLSSVAVMKFNDRFVQNTYDALFQVPSPPPPPNVKVAELDGQVILDWGSDLARVTDIETRVSNPGAYKFEGYNVYQLPSRGSRLSEGKRIVTYDLESDPAVVLDEQFDQKSGQILRLPVQFGSNSGIKRYFNFTRDYIRDIDKLYNGQEYYLVVTAYSVSTIPGYLPATLESSPIVLTVRAQVPFGKVFGSVHGDTLKVTHVGVSDGVVRPIVIDPTVSTGDTYEVRFDTVGGETTWKLINKTKNKVLLSHETNQSGDENYKFIDGIFLKVEGPPPGMKEWSIPNGARRWTWADATGFGLEGFEGAIGWGEHWFSGTTLTADKVKNVLIKLAAADGTWNPDNPGADPNFSYAYRYLRRASAAPAKPEFAPFITNPGPGYAYQGFKKSVPFSAWDVEASPPRRLAVGHLENNVTGGLVDGRYWPPPNGAGFDNVATSGPREWFFIFDVPYSETPDPLLTVDILNTTVPLMWIGTPNRRGGANFSAGDEFLITANHVNTINDVFTYTAPAPQTGIDLQKASAAMIGVFPNPYFAFNAAETNRFVRFVTFNHLPQKATIRIFNLAGQLVRTIQKDDPSQFLRWDLNNQDNFPVASGIYIVHVDMPDLGIAKVLKVAIIQEQEVLDTY